MSSSCSAQVTGRVSSRLSLMQHNFLLLPSELRCYSAQQGGSRKTEPAMRYCACSTAETKPVSKPGNAGTRQYCLDMLTYRCAQLSGTSVLQWCGCQGAGLTVYQPSTETQHHRKPQLHRCLCAWCHKPAQHTGTDAACSESMASCPPVLPGPAAPSQPHRCAGPPPEPYCAPASPGAGISNSIETLSAPQPCRPLKSLHVPAAAGMMHGGVSSSHAATWGGCGILDHQQDSSSLTPDRRGMTLRLCPACTAE